MGDMNEIEKKKFEEFWSKFDDRFTEKAIWKKTTKLSKKDLLFMSKLLHLEIMNLKKTIFFIILALAGEGYCTGELKEAMKRTGLLSLYEEFLRT